MTLRPSALTTARACALLGVSRSRYYELCRPTRHAPAGEATLPVGARVEELCLEWPRYGYRRITAQLRREGFVVNRKRVHRLMREAHLCCRIQRRYVRTTDSQHGFGRFPNLVRELRVEQLNQVWVADFTYIRLRDHFVYLAVVLDSFSRRVIGWDLSERPTTAMCVRALRQALAARRPEVGFIHHSDQGVQNASTDYVALLQEHGACLSMSRVGNPYDNAQAESFLRTLKQEEVYLVEYRDVTHARERIGHFLEDVYNEKRLHSALAYQPPTEFEQQFRSDLS